MLDNAYDDAQCAVKFCMFYVMMDRWLFISVQSSI